MTNTCNTAQKLNRMLVNTIIKLGNKRKKPTGEFIADAVETMAEIASAMSEEEEEESAHSDRESGSRSNTDSDSETGSDWQ